MAFIKSLEIFLLLKITTAEETHKHRVWWNSPETYLITKWEIYLCTDDTDVKIPAMKSATSSFIYSARNLSRIHFKTNSLRNRPWKRTDPVVVLHFLGNQSWQTLYECICKYSSIGWRHIWSPMTPLPGWFISKTWEHIAPTTLSSECHYLQET